jgi:hypothetical protein
MDMIFQSVFRPTMYELLNNIKQVWLNIQKVKKNKINEIGAPFWYCQKVLIE